MPNDPKIAENWTNPTKPQAMTQKQVEVFGLLRSLSTGPEKFHEWYQGCLESLISQASDRMAQAAHSIREICDRLPQRIASIAQPKPVVSALKSFGPELLKIKADYYASGWIGNVINEPFNKMLLRLEIVCSEPARTRRLGDVLVSSDPQAELIAKQFRDERDRVFEDIGRFFQNVAHHNHVPTEAEFQSNLEVFESLLLNYLTPRTADQLQELLALMAAPPDSTKMQRVNELVLHKAANFLFFFDKLDNPQWLPVLEEAGYFSNLPGPESIGDGRLIYRNHVPLIALCHIAGKAPDTVTDILAKFNLPNNPLVGTQVLQCMSGIRDAGCIQKLRPLVAQLCENSLRADWIWLEALLSAWSEAKAWPEVFNMIEAYLFAVVDRCFDGYSDDSNTWRLGQIDEKFLVSFASQFPFETATVLFNALCRWVFQERRGYNQSDIEPEAPTSYWLEDFMGPADRHDGPEAILAIRLFAAARCVYEQGEAAKIEAIDEILSANPWQLFTRLRWQLYANFPAKSLEQARKEVLKRIPAMNQIGYNSGGHDFEFAQLLVAHVKYHGNIFLSEEEVGQFARAVHLGPVDKNGVFVESLRDDFVRKQLWPIASLLRGTSLAAYRRLLANDAEISVESYKPRRRGGRSYEVVAVAPREAENLAAMEDGKLWDFLNTWEPKDSYPTSDGWIREDLGSLAAKFAEFVESHPERFAQNERWWKNLDRPEFINSILQRAASRVEQMKNGPKTDNRVLLDQHLSSCLEIATWLVLEQGGRISTKGDEPLHGEPSWDAVIRFIRNLVESKYMIPESYNAKFPRLLRVLIEQEDPRLAELQNPMGDWLTTAINSIRGHTVETVLSLAIRQKSENNAVESWVFELIQSRLVLPGESPAIFALLGSRLRLCIHLFESRLTELPALIFPADRAVHRSAAIVAHFRYDNPWNRIIEVFPQILSTAIDTMVALQENGKQAGESDDQDDFGSRLGTHIAHYYWVGAFSSDVEGENLIARFFKAAIKSTRSSVINHIGSIWDHVTSETDDMKVIAKVMRILDLRVAYILRQVQHDNRRISEYDDELTAVINWFRCECFPFEWRFKHAKQALLIVKTLPHSYYLIKAITDFGVRPDRLSSALELLNMTLKKPSDNLRWSIQFKEIAPIIVAGLARNDIITRQFAIECRDGLLKMGLSEFLGL